MNESERLNDLLARELPAAARCLSDLGRRAAFPKGIPFQAGQARGTEINATIGQLTDGDGSAMPLAPVARGAQGLPTNKAFLYAPVEGPRPLAKAWLARERRQGGPEAADLPSAVPVVTHGLTHGLSLVSGLFCDDDTDLIVPTPAWGNYKLVFRLHASPRLVEYPFFRDGRFNVEGLVERLSQVRRKAVVVLNFPGNPSGYTLTAGEVDQVVQAVASADKPLVVVVDDAYQGWVYEDGLLEGSLYWKLVAALDPDEAVAFKVDGATKELVFFGSRVGFVTHPGTGDAEEALQSKLKFLIRGTVGAVSGPAMAMVEQALADPGLDEAFEERRQLMAGRYRALKQALRQVDDDRLVPCPFNSAYFALLRLGGGLQAEDVRQRLLEASVGAIAFADENALRIAYCSIREDQLPELVARLERVIA